MTKQTIAEQLAREDIEALDDNDKKLKELLCESRDQEITNLTKGMTKPNRPQLSEEMEKRIEDLHKWYVEGQIILHPERNEVFARKMEEFLATAIEDTRLRYVKEIELLKKELFKWDYKEGEGESKNSYNEAIDDVLSILNGKEKQV